MDIKHPNKPTKKGVKMDTQTLLEALTASLYEEIGAESVSAFEEAMLLTANEGLVVRFGDGTEYQITVVKSREGGDR